MKQISIVVLTYNAENYLERLLISLKNHKNIDFEIIIIDSSSEDNTVKISEKYADIIKVIDKKDFDHGGTRALAVELTESDYICFLTQDIILSDDLTIYKLFKYLKDNSLSAAYGRQLPNSNANLMSSRLRLFNYGDTSYIRSIDDKKEYGIKTVFMSDSFALYKKKDLLAVGNFKKKIIFGEDMEIATRLLKNGMKIGYCAESEVYHSHNYNYIQEFKRSFDNGVFHKENKWIIEEFGKAEREGKKLVAFLIKEILKSYNMHMFIDMFIRNLIKYLGYKFGYNYRKLSKQLIVKFSMNRNYWL